MTTIRILKAPDIVNANFMVALLKRRHAKHEVDWPYNKPLIFLVAGENRWFAAANSLHSSAK
jgi:hypothetical protein